MRAELQRLKRDTESGRSAGARVETVAPGGPEDGLGSGAAAATPSRRLEPAGASFSWSKTDGVAPSREESSDTAIVVELLARHKSAGESFLAMIQTVCIKLVVLPYLSTGAYGETSAPGGVKRDSPPY